MASGPWEDYQATTSSGEAGPWADYAPKPSAAAPQPQDAQAVPAQQSSDPSTLQKLMAFAQQAAPIAKSVVGSAIQSAYPIASTITGPALQGSNMVGQALDKAGDTTSEAVGQAVPNHPMLGAAAGMIVKNLPAAIPIPGAQLGGRILGPAISDASRGLVDAAQSIGIPLTRAEMTGSKLPATIEAAIEKTPLGTKLIQDFRTKQGAAIDAAKARLLQAQGTTAEPSEVGANVQQDMQDVLAGRKGAKNTAYEYRNSLIPPTTPVPLTNAMSAAQDVLKQEGMASDGLQDSSVAKIASGLLNTPQAPNAQWMLDQRNRLTAAIKNAGATTPAGVSLIKIKNALDSDFQTFTDSLASKGTNVAGQTLQSANNLAKLYNKNYQELSNNDLVQGLLKKTPEKVVDSIFKPQNVTNINAFKKAATPDAFNLAKKSFTQDLVSSKNPLQELQKYDSETLNAIYSPQDLKTIYNYAIVKAGTKGAEQILGEGHSNTSRNMLSAASMWAPISSAGTALMTGNPGVAAGILGSAVLGHGLSYGAGKAYLSNAATQGIPMTVRPAITSAAARTGMLLSAFRGHLAGHPANQQ